MSTWFLVEVNDIANVDTPKSPHSKYWVVFTSRLKVSATVRIKFQQPKLYLNQYKVPDCWAVTKAVRRAVG